MVVSRELIRVAILWHELWHEALEEASRLFFSEKNAPGMIQALEPLHRMLEAVRRLTWKFSLFIIFVLFTGPNDCSRDFFCSSVWPRTSGGT